MALPDSPQPALIELEAGNKFEYLYPQGGNDYLRQLSQGTLPTEGEDIWAIGVTVKDHAQGIVGREETALEYEPRDSERLKEDYHQSYRELVTPLQDLHSSQESLRVLEDEILLNTVRNMAGEGARLLGGFCVARGKEPGQIFPTVFYSKILSSCYSRILRETILAMDPQTDLPGDGASEEEIEFLRKAVNLDQVDEFSEACGGIVASLLPQAAMVGPTFGKGPKPLS